MYYFFSCNNSDVNPDASGYFTFEEITITAPISGTLKQFNIEIGQALKKDQVIGYVDITKLNIKRKKLESKIKEMQKKTNKTTKDTIPLQIQLNDIYNKLNTCRIVNQIDGNVIGKYVNTDENISTGKPLYKIADVSKIFLTAIIKKKRLTSIKTGQKVKISRKNANKEVLETIGIITYIAPSANSTIKKTPSDQRYTIKIKVNKDDYFKVGFYAEAYF